MIIVVVLAALLLLFGLVRHHVGMPFLAMIAGYAVYSEFGALFTSTICNWIPTLDWWWVDKALNVFFVFLMPVLLYFRAGKSGFFGVMRYVEACVFAVMLTALLAPALSALFSFDNWSSEMLGFIESIRMVCMAVGVIFAYVDVLFYRSGQPS